MNQAALIRELAKRVDALGRQLHRMANMASVGLAEGDETTKKLRALAGEIQAALQEWEAVTAELRQLTAQQPPEDGVIG